MEDPLYSIQFENYLESLKVFLFYILYFLLFILLEIKKSYFDFISSFDLFFLSSFFLPFFNKNKRKMRNWKNLLEMVKIFILMLILIFYLLLVSPSLSFSFSFLSFSFFSLFPFPSSLFLFFLFRLMNKNSNCGFGRRWRSHRINCYCLLLF